MEKEPLGNKFILEGNAKARAEAEMNLAESKKGKGNFPMGSPMSEKEYVEWYVKNKERLAEIEKNLTPEERTKARARIPGRCHYAPWLLESIFSVGCISRTIA